MSNYKGPTEGSSGGKRGHSSMEHWSNTAELKESSKIHRRANDKLHVNNGLKAYLTESSCDECGSNFIATISKYDTLCSECAHWIYGQSQCKHEFSDNRCSKCGWDGSVSSYVASLKDQDHS